MLLDQLVQVIGYNNGQSQPCDQSIEDQHRSELQLSQETGKIAPKMMPKVVYVLIADIAPVNPRG